MGLFSRRPAPDVLPEPDPDTAGTAHVIDSEWTVTTEDELVSADPEPVFEPEPHPVGEYRGRLYGDGAGNLVVYQAETYYVTRTFVDDDGEEITLVIGKERPTGPYHGYPVFHNLTTGLFEFVQPGDPSHNQIHHRQVAEVAVTTSADAHHLRPLETDAHYAADGGRVKNGVATFTRTKVDPDEVADRVTGHTDAYTGASR